MASERIRRRIEILLDEADEAVSLSDWAVVRDRAQNVLRLDPENHDALAYLAAAERDAGSFQTQIQISAAPRPASASVAGEHPTSFQRAFAAYNQEHPEEPVRVWIGLHTGEFVQEMEDFFGKNVILASRIAGQAQGWEILVSSLLKELTESGGDIRFGDVQEVELKGLAGLNRVYAVLWH